MPSAGSGTLSSWPASEGRPQETQSPLNQAPLQSLKPRPQAQDIQPSARGLQPGFTWNPLRRLPPNRECPCQSGKKFKACCKDRLPRAVPSATASLYEEQMKKRNLLFLTDENEEDVRRRLPGGKLPDRAAVDAQAIAQEILKSGWHCVHCRCLNARELASCADCGKEKEEMTDGKL